MDRQRRNRLIAAVVAGQAISALLASRDLAKRADDQVRGSKRFWRVFGWLNPGNSVAYWVVGRR